jgi:hypothetical protein
MSDLITGARAKENLAYNASFTATEDTLIASLVTAVSKAVRAFCRREFDSQEFDELYHGAWTQQLLLRQYPVLSVARVAYGPTAVLQIKNTSGSNQRATVAVTSTGLTLVRVASGTVTTDTSVTFAGNPTLAAVAAAVNALGNGWTATVLSGDYSDYPSADLRAVQGALNARLNGAALHLHVGELSEYDLDAERGILLRSGLAVEFTEGFGDGGTPVWFGGANYWRVVYTAGYATVPEDVQEACAEWVSERFKLSLRDPAINNTFASGSGSAYTQPGLMPERVRGLLLPYRVYTKSR